VQVEEYEEYGDVGVVAATPKFKANTEKELKWAKDKSKTEILERAKQKLARGERMLNFSNTKKLKSFIKVLSILTHVCLKSISIIKNSAGFSEIKKNRYLPSPALPSRDL